MTLTDTEIIAVLGITPRTVRNYRRHGFPKLAAERLSLYEGTHPDWHGYQIRESFIMTPEGDRVTANQISHYYWLQ